MEENTSPSAGRHMSTPDMPHTPRQAHTKSYTDPGQQRGPHRTKQGENSSLEIEEWGRQEGCAHSETCTHSANRVLNCPGGGGARAYSHTWPKSHSSMFKLLIKP